MPRTLVRQNQITRVVAYANVATVTPNVDTTDLGILAVLSQAVILANPIGTPFDGQLLQLRITSTVSRAITFGTAYQAASTLNFPTATTGGSVEDYISFRYNSIDFKWDLIGTTIVSNVVGGINVISGAANFDFGLQGDTVVSTISSSILTLANFKGISFIPIASADHTDLDEYAVEGLLLAIESIIDITSFTLRCTAPELTSGIFSFNYRIIY